MTETERGFLRAIEEEIDNDMPRLVYADFLEEQGDPRGEFIRLQVLRAQAPEPHQVSPREQELLERHEEEWLNDARPFDPEKVRLTFERGFVALAEIDDGTDADLDVLRRLPGLRRLRLESGEVGPTGLGDIAFLRNLREFSFNRSIEIGEDGLAVLEALSPWTRVRCDGGYPDEDAWAAFQERRIARFDSLPSAERRKAALQFLATLSEGRGSSTEVHLTQDALSDAEVRFFREVPELEVLHLFEPYGLTGAAMRFLAGLPKLRSVEIYKASVDDIRPLTRCPALEVLKLSNYMGPALTDEGTEGLENLTNLRVLSFWSGDLGDSTVHRLRPLCRLQDLQIVLTALEDERCLEVLSGLTGLESLSINEYRGRWSQEDGLSEGVLRYLAPLEKLRVLKLHLAEGTGEELRHLAGLTDLRFLDLHGPAVTDAGLAHLGSLRQLRTLIAQPSSVTEAGARALAERLPGATIITMEHVVKSPRGTMAFVRRQLKEWASLLIPEGWGSHYGSGHALEDGWESLTSWSGGVVGPAAFWFHAAEPAFAPTSEEALEGMIQNNSHLDPHVLERDLVRWTGWETASTIFENDHSRHLACAAVRDGRSFTLTCEAPPSRFEEFYPIFLLVARSVRLGESAGNGGAERVEVPVAEFARFGG